ncbi:MAG: gas vesicle protein GvpK [Candidatus Nanopelagicales bacterium]|nr:gas vesicle protein GvpK [Candidatus Nanopelagicales bacterium]MDZ4249140.1 gas vesicle protein GvpK [Candidatus Nanopelagicales bacterium]MDZ7578948.1 gas vesicle protein GvpK [Candidatus Nanopelagicales bacterium]
MVEVHQEDLKRGLLGLVMALVEVIQEVLANAALQRVEAGSLNDDEVERLGNAMAAIEEAIAEIKAELGVEEVTQDIRDQLDAVVNDLVTSLADSSMDASGLLGRQVRIV